MKNLIFECKGCIFFINLKKSLIMKNKKLNLPVLLKNTRVLSTTAAVLAAGLLSLPVQAGGINPPKINYKNIFVTESRKTYLDFNDRQGADGTDWIWRHQAMLNDIVKCPSNSVKNCSAFPSGQYRSADVSFEYIFSVTPLNGFYKKVMKFKIKNPDRFVGNHKKVFTGILPNIILKPGEYAIPTIISLNKWIPLGKGKIEKGEFNHPVYYDPGNGTIESYEKLFSVDGQIGTWEGHSFKGHRIHVCINRTGLLPKLGDEVTCNAPAKIPVGVAP
jgi:hypothetical protein